jgi:predicted MPP superfamily phosphohydrolase
MFGKNKKMYKSLAAIFLIFLVWSIVEARLLFLNKYDFYSENLPEVFSGYRVAFVTDIHAGIFFGIKRVDRMVEKINKENPDLVILGGDYVFAGKGIVSQLAESLGKIEAPIIAVMGNHDNWEDGEGIRREFSANGIEVLDNDGKWIGRKVERIRIAGVDDWQTSVSVLGKALSETSEKDFVILASHNPDVTYLLDEEKRVDLVLSGHTHGGQISLFGLFSPLLPISHGQDYASGWVIGNNFKLFVSRGVGGTILPIRFFASPEWNIITLHR